MFACNCVTHRLADFAAIAEAWPLLTNPRIDKGTRRLLAALIFSALSLTNSACAASLSGRSFDVLQYTATLKPDLQTKTLTGVESIDLAILVDGTTQLEFDVGDLSIDRITSRGRPLEFSLASNRLSVALPHPAEKGARLKVAIHYHGSPHYGLQFHPEASQIYTVFSTSQWLVTVDAPDERAALDLSVVLPASYRAVGNGELVSTRKMRGDKIVHRWRQRQPIPSFAYGFAAGEFAQFESTSNGIPLTFSSRTLSEEQSAQLFANTGDMLAFFAEVSGVPYRGKYDQVLVTETIGQEAGGYALLSEAYGTSTLEKSTSEDLIAHEIAHQWWGIGTTCRSWGEFWLNEGFANFMAAAYLQRRYGDAPYLLAIERWRMRYEKLKSDGKDHALAYAKWDKSTGDDRAVVYQKGAYVLHLLRMELGEAAFWKGIRAYSRQFAGASVVTRDLKDSLERSSGRDLDDFFSRWVDSGGSSDLY